MNVIISILGSVNQFYRVRSSVALEINKAQQDGRLRAAQLKMVTMLKEVDAICQEFNLDYWLEGGTLLGAIRHQGFIPWDDDLDISMPRHSYEKFLQVAPSRLPEHLFLQTAQSEPGYFNLAAPLKIRDLNSRFVEVHETGNEPYQQGIFLDVFVYDTLDANEKQAKRDKFRAKKLLRLLRTKCTPIAMGHHARIYDIIGRFCSQQKLEQALVDIIQRSKNLDSPWMGYGYDCVNQNRVHRDDIYPLRRVAFENEAFYIANRSEVILQQLFGDYMQLPPENERVMKHCKELIPHINTPEKTRISA